ncbi:MAG TPA: acyl carrier protein [Opitutaceae bacterium]|nr:acyl carrier protein [Opitutaceae bacterium]
MSSQPILDPSSKLDRFPIEVRDAFRRFRATGEPADLQMVVLAVLRDHMPKRSSVPLTEEMRLMEDLGYDSLAVAEIIFFFEDLFQVRIENRELPELRTVGEVGRFVARKLGQKPAAA